MSPVLPDVGTTSNPPRAERNWNEFRGFRVVTATDTISGVVNRSFFYQGMHGDRASVGDPNLFKTVSIILAGDEVVTDLNNRAGLEADHVTFRVSNGDKLVRRRTDYFQSTNPTNGFTPNTQNVAVHPVAVLVRRTVTGRRDLPGDGAAYQSGLVRELRRLRPRADRDPRG